MLRLAIAIVCVPVLASADRAPVVIVGAGTEAMLFPDAPGPKPERAGGELTVIVGFEDPSVPVVVPTLTEHRYRFVPELLGGVELESGRGEAFLGAGLRGEIQIAAHVTPRCIRIGMYAALRGRVVGGDHDPEADGALGWYFLLGRGATRIGMEAELGERWTDAGAALAVHPSVFVGWKL